MTDEEFIEQVKRDTIAISMELPDGAAGFMQLIPSTFAEYSSDSALMPMSSIEAVMNYIKTAYGMDSNG